MHAYMYVRMYAYMYACMRACMSITSFTITGFHLICFLFSKSVLQYKEFSLLPETKGHFTTKRA